MNVKLCKMLKKAREDRKITLRQASEKLGYTSDSTIHNWESGTNDPPIEKFIQLCNFYGVDYCELLYLAYGDPCSTKYRVECDNDEFELLSKYREMGEGSQNVVKATLNALFENTVSAAKKKSS